MTIRFHLDEHIHPGIAVGLRARGIDVTTAVVADLLGAEDTQHLAFALQEGRVVVTHDDDYLRLHVRGVQHAGIAYGHRVKYPVGGLLRALLLLHACDTTEEMQNRVEYL